MNLGDLDTLEIETILVRDQILSNAISGHAKLEATNS